MGYCIDFLRSLCKYGLPKGNVYEFAAQQVLKYERKYKDEALKDKTQKYADTTLSSISTIFQAYFLM